MDIAAILKWLEVTALATQIRESLFLFLFAEAAHVIGLALVFEPSSVLDLRLLGFASSERPVRQSRRRHSKSHVDRLRACRDHRRPDVYHQRRRLSTTPISVKMLLLALSGVNMAAFEVTARKSVQEWDTAKPAPRSGRLSRPCSLVLLISIIFTGRLIGFTTSHATKEAPGPAGREL